MEPVIAFKDTMPEVYPDSPAYPAAGQSGLTKREHFAAMAMQGLCASGFFTDRRMQQKSEDAKDEIDFELATSALSIADALIEALNTLY